MAKRGRTNGTVSTRSKGDVSVFLPSASFRSLSYWTVATVRAALDAHEQGDLSSSSLLAEAILRDGAIFSALQTRAFALSSRAGLPFALDPSMGVDDRRAKSVADDMEDLWWVCFGEAQVAAMDRDAIVLGVSIGRDEKQLVEGEWVPRIKRLRPAGLRWVDSEQCFHYIDGNGIDHVVTPGENGWILHAPHGGDSWMFGAIRSIGIPWIGRIDALRDFMRYSERHGMPALAVEEPYNASDDVEGDGGSEGSQTDAFYARLKRLPQEALIRLCQPADKDTPGWKAYWLELKSRNHDTFKDLVGELRREVTAILLGRDPDSAASAVGGDGASLLERVRGEFLSADAEGLATTFREQVLKPWVRESWDPKRPELAPWPHWDTRPPVDMAARATTLNTLGDALTKLKTSGVDTRPILEEFHLVALPESELAGSAPQASPTDPSNPAEESNLATVHSIRRFAAYAQPFRRAERTRRAA